MQKELAVGVVPKSGDLLVSRRSARADVYQISVVNDRVHVDARTYREAIEKARGLGGLLAVDVWFTCDHMHYAVIAQHRREARLRCRNASSSATA